MNYLNIYNAIINRAQSQARSRSVAYYESHHIIPRCIGGTDNQSNLVLLTPEEHYVAHQLLVKLNPTNTKLIWAAHMMCTNNKGQRRSNKSFGWLRRKMAENGRKHTPETKAKIRATKAANPTVLSTETKAKMSASRKGNQNAKGFKHTDETRAKVSAAGKGKPKSESAKANMRGRTFTPEQIAVFSQKRKEYWDKKRLNNLI